MAPTTPPGTGEDSWDRQVTLLLERHGGPNDPHPSPLQLTPQMAFRLIVAAEDIVEKTREDPDFLHEDDALPPRVLANAAPEFVTRYVQCYSDLADRIRTAEIASTHWPPLVQCVGEAVALAHILRTAAEDHATGFIADVFADALDRLATDPERDSDFDWYDEILFEDRDFELLWQADLDGIEDDEAIASRLGYANLQPAKWFLPFTL